MIPVKIAILEKLASETIGDSKTPNLFFVTDQGTVVLVSRAYAPARDHYRQLAGRRPLVECALEARNYGVLADVSPCSDGVDARLCISNAPDNDPT